MNHFSRFFIATLFFALGVLAASFPASVSAALAVSCSASPASPMVGDTVTWTAAVTGTASSYSWTGTDGLSGTGQTAGMTYGTAGTKSATVTVTSPGTASYDWALQSSGTEEICSGGATNYPHCPPPTSCTAGQHYACTTSSTVCSSKFVAQFGMVKDFLCTVAPSDTEHDSYVCTGSDTGYGSPLDFSGQGPGIISNHWLAHPGPEAYDSVPPGFASNPQNYCVQLTQNTQACAKGGGACIPDVSWSYEWYSGSGVTFQSSAGKYPAAGNRYESWTFASSGSGPETASNSCSVNVSALPPPPPPPPSLPDLTAGDATPTTASPGATVTLSAPVTNVGAGGTGSGFTDIFEINPNGIPPDFASIQAIRSFSSGALGVAGGNTMTSPYTFPSAGIYYVRACADLNLSNSGSINESNEGNNCGNWVMVSVGTSDPAGCTNPNGCAVCTSSAPGGCGPGSSFCNQNPTDSRCIVVPPPPPPPPPTPSALLIATPPSVVYGGTSRLDYACTNATGASVDHGVGAVSPVSGGHVDVSPPSSTTYTLTCANGGGGNSAWDTAVVTILSPTVSITASPTIVRAGGSSTITWSVTGHVDACSISGPGLSSTALSNSVPETITSVSTYTISCRAGSFRPTASVTVKIAPSFKEF